MYLATIKDLAGRVDEQDSFWGNRTRYYNGCKSIKLFQKIGRRLENVYRRATRVAPQPACGQRRDGQSHAVEESSVPGK